MCSPQILFCLLMFWLIALKQLNSMTRINTVYSVVQKLHGVREIPGSIPGYGKGFNV